MGRAKGETHRVQAHSSLPQNHRNYLFTAGSFDDFVRAVRNMVGFAVGSTHPTVPGSRCPSCKEGAEAHQAEAFTALFDAFAFAVAFLRGAALVVFFAAAGFTAGFGLENSIEPSSTLL